jgi:tetratricopeptide (TPR) repeat protein
MNSSVFTAFATLLLCVGTACAAPFVINNAGTQIDGSAIEASADGTIRLTALNGQTLTFRPGAYRQALADKPAELGQAEALARNGDLAGASGLLRQIKQRYRFLGWDQRASQMLARILLAQKQFSAAIAEYDELFAAQPQLRQIPAERANFVQALIGAGRTADATALLNADVASGSRDAAARALLLRGDLKSATGQHEEALLDYLRVALLFREQTALCPEALYKTAAALKRRGDPRATEWFERLRREFPGSSFAQQAKGEMR